MKNQETKVQHKHLQELFARYNTKLRKRPSVVTHAAYGTRTKLTPLQFAVYETAIKANALAWRNAEGPLPRFDSTDTPVEDNAEWYEMIATKDGFKLHYDPSISMEQANEDYYICVDWLAEEGLYHDLVD
jgi:hypothetical protein